MKDLNETSLADFRQASKRSRLATRVNEANPNHHLWNNRGTWWCHFTVHRPDYTSERVRISLKTREIERAREYRDELLKSLCE
ncbi:MAG: hypothetical protein P1U81_04195 [Verrucomicrobiales bacterium]|nr:hypothetical protein [Verrucomicrobiales bacterium]